MDLNITVKEASEIMHKSQAFVIQAVQNGQLPGIVIENNGRRSVHIPRVGFENYMNGLKKEPSQKLVEGLIEEYKSSKEEIKKLDRKIIELNKKINKGEKENERK